MRKPRFFSPDLYYHLICRGNNQNIFLYKKDFEKYVYGLDKYSNKFLVEIISFALMPNHVHLLIKQKSETSISKFMQVVTTSYATYFNLKYKRKGHLFEGRYKHIAVETDEYLVHLSRYIHLNPTSASIVKKPKDYYWSSYRHYLGLERLDFVDEKPILSYFSSNDPIKDYGEFVESRIDYQKEISLQKLFAE